MINRVLVLESVCSDDSALDALSCVTPNSAKGILISYKDFECSGMPDTWSKLEPWSIIWSRCDYRIGQEFAKRRPEDALLVIIHTFSYTHTTTAFKDTIWERVKKAQAYGAQPTFLMEDKEPKWISVYEMIGGCRVRHDGIAYYNAADVNRYGAMGIIKREQFKKELEFFIDPRATKYGA